VHFHPHARIRHGCVCAFGHHALNFRQVMLVDQLAGAGDEKESGRADDADVLEQRGHVALERKISGAALRQGIVNHVAAHEVIHRRVGDSAPESQHQSAVRLSPWESLSA
jgi:hypothetical protein